LPRRSKRRFRHATIAIPLDRSSEESAPIGCARRSGACRAAAVPVFSPHDLRHRRISLLHRQGRTWAEIGRLVGQRKLSLTADTYTHVLSDGRELDYAALIGELA
jgi:integrase